MSNTYEGIEDNREIIYKAQHRRCLRCKEFFECYFNTTVMCSVCEYKEQAH